MTTPPESTAASNGKRRPLYTAISIAIVIAGVAVAVGMVLTKPKAKPAPRTEQTPIVEVVELVPTTAVIQIGAMGTVMPSGVVDLQPEVSGRITWVHPDLEPGGFVAEGDVLVKIDSRDYEIAMQRAQAALETARGELRLELGQQDIARQEWMLVNSGEGGEELDLELALRQPQLQQKQAAVASAQAGVDAAALSLERTQVRAPFDAAVLDADIHIGDSASPNVLLARLVVTEEYWIKAAVKVSDLKWLRFPTPEEPESSSARILLPGGGVREGRLFRLLPDLQSQGRMAQVLVTVPDPLLLEEGGDRADALLLDSYVRVSLAGRSADGVVRIPRTAYREGAYVWLLDGEGRLRIRSVNVLWASEEEIIVAYDFMPRERLIVSSLAGPVEGMSLTAEGENGARGPAGPEAPEKAKR